MHTEFGAKSTDDNDQVLRHRNILVNIYFKIKDPMFKTDVIPINQPSWVQIYLELFLKSYIFYRLIDAMLIQQKRGQKKSVQFSVGIL